MKISLATWMNDGLLTIARNFFQSEAWGARSKEYKEIMEEGYACLKNAKPEYLINLIPQNHPDRIEAVKILIEYFAGSI